MPSDLISNNFSIIIILVFQFVIILVILVIARNLLRRHRALLLNAEKENEIFLKELIVAQPAAIYRVIHKAPSSFDNDGMPLVEYDYLSSQHEVITGLSIDELKNDPMRISRMVYSDDRQGFIEENAKAVSEFRPFKWEGRYMVKGKIKWLHFESNPHLRGNGDTYWTGVIMDITRQKEMENQMIQHLRFEKLISEISGDFVNIKMPFFDEILTHTLGKVGNFCQIDRAYLFTWDQNRDMIQNTHEWCQDGIEPQINHLQEIPCGSIPMWMNSLKNLTPIISEDIEKLPVGWEVEKGILRAQDIKSVAIVPITSHEKLIGFVGFDSVKKYRKWENYEIQLLRVFADLLYNALARKGNEIDLLESKQMLRSVLDNIVVRVFWKDRDLKFLGCNRAFARDAGFNSPDEIIGLNDYDLCWKEYAEKYRKNDLEVINSGVPLIEFVEPHTDIHGNKRTKRTSKIPLKDTQGNIIGILGTSMDITEQKMAEEALKTSEKKYRVLTENAFDGIYLLGRNSFEYANQRFCELTGYSYDELVNQNFDASKMISEETRSIFFERKQARLKNIEIPRTYEIGLISKSGKVIDVEISTTPLGTGENLLVLGIVREISERKNNEKLLREVAIAKQSVQFKQSFLANMSHEIRTPLTGVLGMIELLAQTNLDKQQIDFVNTLKLSTENLREIINQILDYSKIEAGRVKLRKNVFHKKAILENAKKLFASICYKNIRLETSIDAKIPEFIKADEPRLSQVIFNLLSNAVKFTLEGKITITAELKQWINFEEFEVEIKVSDTGIGIKKEFLPRLFIPFEQYEHKSDLYFEGTGLGLSISKELVALLGGELTCKSEEGKGSTFTFTFIGEKIENNKKQKTAAKLEIGEKTRKLRILFAEDKIVNQKVVSLMLKSLGHEVVLAHNGKDALDKFKPGLFDLILMDIQMPVMDGLTATNSLKKTYSDLPPIVGISANAFEGDREKYMQMGMDEYITKPVKALDFTELIKKLFN